MSEKKQVGIIGGGPSGLFMLKRLIEAGDTNILITIFERKDQLGAGMPYSNEGAGKEHVTNVSDNEIPGIVTSIQEWTEHAPTTVLQSFDIKPGLLNEYKVLPRLFFGEYLSAQFDMLLELAKTVGLKVRVILNANVVDVKDLPNEKKVKVFTASSGEFLFDTVVISTGHNWPKKHEGTVENWFDSPYPPAKLAKQINFPVAIKGASLTAIDVVRTLARCNGYYQQNEDSSLTYHLNKDSEGFAIVMHSIDGLLPAIRFHLEDTHLSIGGVMDEEEMQRVIDENNGFIPLDYLFERNFKNPLREYNPEFYEQVKHLTVEEFVDRMMSLREKVDPFVLFKAEYAEAEKSIRRKQSVYWKEMLASLSFAMNYPAKHLSAEDMLRLNKTLMPLISIIIAFVPQSSCRELIALHNAGLLTVIAVDKKSNAQPQKEGGAVYTFTNEDGIEQQVKYKMFVDAVGQPRFMFDQFLFKSLRDDETVSKAMLRFRSAEEGQKEKEGGNDKVLQSGVDNYYLQVPGININDNFQVLDKYGVYNSRIYIMAVPYIAGLNPDYSGLDFCEEASARIVSAILTERPMSDNRAA